MGATFVLGEGGIDTLVVEGVVQEDETVKARVE